MAPDNDAWDTLPRESFDYIVNNPAVLQEILSYHIVPMNLTRRDFSNNMMVPSLYRNLPVHINFYTDGWASVSISFGFAVFISCSFPFLGFYIRSIFDVSVVHG